MIIIIQGDTSDQWNGYKRWTEKVYDIDATNDEIMQAWENYMLKKFEEAGVKIASVITHTIFIPVKEYLEHAPFCMKSAGVFHKVKSENNFIKWLEKKYKVKSLKFDTILL